MSYTQATEEQCPGNASTALHLSQCVVLTGASLASWQMVVQLVAAFNKYAAQTEEDDEDAEDMGESCSARSLVLLM
jgi:hypothetical protein